MPVLSAYSRTPSSAWIIGMDVPSRTGARAGSGASGPGQVLDAHDVPVGEGRGRGGVPGPQRVQDLRVLAHRFGVRGITRGPPCSAAHSSRINDISRGLCAYSYTVICNSRVSS